MELSCLKLKKFLYFRKELSSLKIKKVILSKKMLALIFHVFPKKVTLKKFFITFLEKIFPAFQDDRLSSCKTKKNSYTLYSALQNIHSFILSFFINPTVKTFIIAFPFNI